MIVLECQLPGALHAPPSLQMAQHTSVMVIASRVSGRKIPVVRFHTTAACLFLSTHDDNPMLRKYQKIAQTSLLQAVCLDIGVSSVKPSATLAKLDWMLLATFFIHCHTKVWQLNLSQIMAVAGAVYQEHVL